ncbi:MAG: glucosylceramidase [Proteobacteria bacterium]|nr:MAG: glucosylceramidase [Pseudomonadota bacterium]
MTSKIRHIKSAKDAAKKFAQQPELSFKPDNNYQEMQLLMIYSDITYQTITGFGGAFTEASAINYYQMSSAIQQQIKEAYFGTTGLKYNLGRTHIASCDFSTGNYQYLAPNDVSLTSFDLSQDHKYIIPFIHECLRYSIQPISLMASPWSPPEWMKDNQNLLKGGKLLTKYYQLYAEYLAKYLKEYAVQNITINYLTIQNEPYAVQRWESCIYRDQDELVFIRDHLYPTLVNHDLHTTSKIVIWDHNKEHCFMRARHILADKQAYTMIHGIAFHWYSGDHFENLRLCKEFFPDKELFFTEGCVELSVGSPTNSGGNENVAVIQSPWEFGEKYAHDLIGNFNNGMSAYIDWNLLLDTTGGPNHVSNFCSAPIICDAENQTIHYQPSYYFIGHFSKYVPQGSKRIAHSCYTDKLEISCFLTPEQKIVTVVFNSTEKDIPLIIKDVTSNGLVSVMIDKKSINTFIYNH